MKVLQSHGAFIRKTLQNVLFFKGDILTAILYQNLTNKEVPIPYCVSYSRNSVIINEQSKKVQK